MKQVPFGKSSIKVSEIGLGLAALGRPGYINIGHGADISDKGEGAMERHTQFMLDKAIEKGITYVDAARSYGKAEAFLGSWLRSSPFCKMMTVGSKWGYYYTANWQVEADRHEIKEHTLERLNDQWEQSVNHLAPNLKLYQIHSATFESGVLGNKDVLSRLEEIREGGTIIGLSLSGPNQSEVLREAMKISIGSQPLFGSVQATYNILEPSVRTALQKAHDNGLAVIVKEALANGRLTDRSQLKHLSLLSSIAHKHKTTIDAIAIAFVLQEPFVTTVLSGAVTDEQLSSNVKATKVELDMADGMVLGQLEMSPEAYWKERGEMEWN